MKLLTSIVTVLFLVSISGCATLFGNNSRTVHVNSDPAGASIYLDGNPVGTTPGIVTIDSTWSNHNILLKKNGYEPRYASINSTFQPVTILDVLFWPTLIVDGISGNMMKIADSSRTINADLTPAHFHQNY